MAYIGSTPTSQNFIAGTDYFNGTGSQTAFTLTRSVNSVNDIEVTINNVVQQPNSYTVSGTTLTISAAPSSGTSNVYVRYLSTTLQSITVPNNSITYAKLDSNLQADIQGRNRIINGSMVIDQRNAGASVANAGQYTLDRWAAYGSSVSKFNIQQNAGSVTPPVGFTNYLGVTSTASTSLGASDEYVIFQKIEGYNVADLGWGTANAKTVTLSFWVRSSLTGTFGGTVTNAGYSYAYPFSYTISSANTWEQKSITIVGPTSGSNFGTTNGVGLYLHFSLGAGSTVSGTGGSWGSTYYASTTGATSVVGTNGATWYITGVQLEEGTTATSFERESYSVTLQKCQRYYYKIVGTTGGSTFGLAFNRNTTTAQTFVNFQTSMRSAPTALETNGTGSDYQVNYLATATACNAVPTFDKATVYGSDIYFTVASGLTAGQCSKPASVSTSAYLAWSSEL